MSVHTAEFRSTVERDADMIRDFTIHGEGCWRKTQRGVFFVIISTVYTLTLSLTGAPSLVSLLATLSTASEHGC